MRTIAVANHKGGTGKTTTAHTVGVVLANRDYRVLLVDSDPQSSLTLACGVASTQGRSLANVLGGAEEGELSLAKVVRFLSPSLDLVPADVGLASSELGLMVRMGRENALKEALGEVNGRYDVCIIDCPPSLGLLTVNALTAAHGVLIPTQPQIADLRGLGLFLLTIARIQGGLNPGLETIGIVATLYDRRLIHHRRAMKSMRNASLPLLPTTVGRSVRVAESSVTSETVVTYAKDNPRAQEYEALTDEVVRWLEKARTGSPISLHQLSRRMQEHRHRSATIEQRSSTFAQMC